MKKYNLSKIMKKAWELNRKFKNLFCEALKMSWKMAKCEILLKKEDYEEYGTVTFNVWVGYGKIRAYYTCSWKSNYANNKKNNFISLI